MATTAIALLFHAANPLNAQDMKKEKIPQNLSAFRSEMPTCSMQNFLSANDAANAEATPQSGELSADTTPDCPTIKQ